MAQAESHQPVPGIRNDGSARIADQGHLRAFFQLNHQFGCSRQLIMGVIADQFLVDRVVLQQFLRRPRILARDQVRLAERGEPGLLISFEEFPQSLQTEAQSLGWDLRPWQERGLLHLYFTSPRVLFKSLEAPAGPMSDLFLEKNIKRVVLDSVTHFTRLTNDQLQLRHIYNQLINALKREGPTSMLLAEEARLEAPRVERGALSFVVDSILLLRYVEVESAIQRAIAVVKRGEPALVDAVCQGR